MAESLSQMPTHLGMWQAQCSPSRNANYLTGSWNAAHRAEEKSLNHLLSLKPPSLCSNKSRTIHLVYVSSESAGPDFKSTFILANFRLNYVSDSFVFQHLRTWTTFLSIFFRVIRANSPTHCWGFTHVKNSEKYMSPTNARAQVVFQGNNVMIIILPQSQRGVSTSKIMGY